VATTHRILYVGVVDPSGYATSTHRLRALRDLGHEVLAIDSTLPAASLPRRLLRRLERRFLRVVRHPSLDREILDGLRSSQPDILWLDKIDCLRPETLEEARRLQPGIRIVGFSLDDMMNPDNKIRFFVEALPCYDIYFTTKSFGVPELEAFGCPRVEFVDNSFDPNTHRPVELSAEERERYGGPVGFIGTYEEERAHSIAALGRAGITVKVWGNGWKERASGMNPNVMIAGPSMGGETYAKIINSFDINLAYLRKCNRDLQTTRSVEIPACGKFMLAERSEEHLALFEEGVEAEFFADDQELLTKTRYYLDHPEEREKIAAAGRQRCIESGHSNQERLRSMLARVDELD
jgi:spore maturation protein CgeB